MRVLSVVLLCLGLAAAASTKKEPQRQRLGLPRYQRQLRPPPVRSSLGVDLDLEAVTVSYFENQLLDHFDPSNNATWRQRYFSNPIYYEEDGPIFLFIEGESEASSDWIYPRGSYMAELAATFKAKMFVLEHRFFGQSRPTPDISTPNLKWLSADQALADLAYFIEFLIEKGEMKEGQKLAVFGGSYPGNLAAWARLKYPHLIHAAVASSAPVRAEEDFKEYMEVVTRSIKKLGGQVCADNLEKAFNRIKKLLMTTDGKTQIQNSFYMCDPLDVDNKLDMDFFYEILANPFAIASQYNRDGYTTYNVKAQCSYMGGEGIDEDEAVENLAKVFYYSQGYIIFCIDWSYKANTGYLTNTKYSDGSRQWVYMTCALFGYFQTPDGDTVFPKGYASVDYFLQQCKDAFGDPYDDATVKRAVKRTNTVFGDWKPDVENVLWVNGEIDPWHSLSVTKDLNEKSPAILMSGTSHCYDMYANSASDSAELRDARQKIKDFLTNTLYSGAVVVDPTLGTSDD